MKKFELLVLELNNLRMGAPPMIDIGNMTSAIEIAEQELRERKTPLVVIRKMPNGDTTNIPISDFIDDPYTELFG